jgi:acetyl esterase
LRDEGEAYARRLNAAGVPATLRRYEGMIHGFIRRTARLDKARAALNEVAAFLRGAFLIDWPGGRNSKPVGDQPVNHPD